MNKKDEKLISFFEDIKKDERITNSTIKIQNNINVYANSKVIAISAAKDDIAIDIVARTISEVYAMQGQSTLLIDCDMYNPSLNILFNMENVEIGLNDIFTNEVDMAKLVTHFSDNLDIVFTKKTNYPTDIFLSKEYNDFIDKAKEKYKHILLIIPSIIEHQDILLSQKIITSVLLIARKNKVSKKDLFNSISFLKSNDMPYVGVVYLK